MYGNISRPGYQSKIQVGGIRVSGIYCKFQQFFIYVVTTRYIRGGTPTQISYTDSWNSCLR